MSQPWEQDGGAQESRSELCVAAGTPWRLQAELPVSSTSPGRAPSEIFFPLQVLTEGLWV